MEIVSVDINSTDRLVEFAKDVFIDYYEDLIGIEQCEYMVNLFLSKKAITRLIEEGAVFRVLIDNDSILGFTEYIKEEDRVFLSKLYVDKRYRQQGYGKILYEDCVKYTLDNNLNKIYLTVNKYNTPSYEIYKHLGFKVIDSVVNDIGNGFVMDDYIMQVDL